MTANLATRNSDNTNDRSPTLTTGQPTTLSRVIHFEWIKLRTLRSTWIGLAAFAALLIAFGAIAAAVSTGSVGSPPGGGSQSGNSDPLETVLTGAQFGVLLLGVLGCLAGAREYGSRMITATVAAVPRRWPVVVAKAAVLAAVVLPAALIACFVSFQVGMAILSANDAATLSLSDDGVLLALIGMAGYLTAIALLGLSLGVLLRSVAASIGVLLAGVLVLPTLAGALLPESWDTVLQYLPTQAAASFTAVGSSDNATLGSTGGIVVLGGWVVVALVAAVAAIMRRDV